MGSRLVQSDKLPEWNEFQSMTKKLNKVFGALGMPVDTDKRPLSSMQRMKTLRDTLERFPAKWKPVRVKKTRQIKNLEPRSDSIGTEKTLAYGKPVEASTDEIIVARRRKSTWHPAFTSGRPGKRMYRGVNRRGVVRSRCTRKK
jgi:hypothetical protein